MIFLRKNKFLGKHVLVTGGSAGIGLSIAKEFRKWGAHVTLLARNASRLESARQELEKVTPQHDPAFEPQICTVSADVSNFNQVQDAVAAAVSQMGAPVDVLICNAGYAQPGMFHEQDIIVFQQHMDVNYMGAVNCIKAVFSGMLQRGAGQICVVSSALGVLGFAGYSSYAASKHALVGLADCLRNETCGTGVQVSLCLPPDTDTPGFKEENKHKPKVTHTISDSSSLYSPDQVAVCVVKGMSRGDYILPSPDPLLGVMYTSVKGFRPRTLWSIVWDMLVGLITPLVYWPWVAWADSVVAKQQPVKA